MTTRITETVYQEALPGVDADAGTLKGVKLLGLNSRNGRRYESAALESAVSLYEGRKVYVDHPRREEAGSDRSFNDWAGIIENVRYKRGDGLYGDVTLRREGDYFKGIIEAASHPKFHKGCGFSHVADGESHFDGDTEIVESIKEVFSVDLVTDPATTKGMYESARKKKRTFKSAIESLPESPQRTRLIEMAGEYGISDMAMDSDDKAKDPLSEIAGMCRELIRMLGEALVAKNTPPPPAAPAPAPNPTAEAPEDEMKTEPKQDPTSDKGADKSPDKAEFEKFRKENAELKAKNLLLESGLEATPARVKALASADEADRKELLESWPVTEGERPARSPALIESGPGAAPEDIRERFASLCAR